MTDSIVHGLEPLRSVVVPELVSLVHRLYELDLASPVRSPLRRLFGSRALVPEAQRSFAAAQSDVAVARELARLAAGWTVFRWVGSSDGINASTRLVAGPGGAFVISIIDEPGQELWVDDFVLAVGARRSDAISQSRKLAKEISAALSAVRGTVVYVAPVIAVADARSVTYANDTSRVVVLGVGRLSRWLSQRPRQLSRAEVAGLDAAALQARGNGFSLIRDDSLEFEAQFELIAARLQQAHRRVVTWIGIAATLVVAVAATVFLAR